ncbi:TetR family transcriptional regulator [Gracilibacillus oryzae]|uniref:TetR family transcriptional regulator n=1 Tax=Gracilibacillus oryzae TaxID=1672701 RepID=A0A7C8GTX0_9BACI|nr:TetR/AcrR family transcriptional regulator [Gracilibacillus oryzae]KAB8137582.1 TetR family transcriptional regulator [Gracilibacillus oryzae]
MPKIVDHDQRKVHIAEATWKVIVENGLEKATVRKVAATAGLSVGSLRHYFSTQSELLQFSMKLVTERVTQRIQSSHYKGDRVDIAIQALGEMLPLDEERKIEMEVWFVFSSKTLVDKKLKQLSEATFEEMHNGLINIMQFLQKGNLLKPGLDEKLEISRLHAIIDGMALHHLLHPDKLTYEKMIDTLTYHLKSIVERGNES